MKSMSFAAFVLLATRANGVSDARVEVAENSTCSTRENKGDWISNNEMPPSLTVKGYCTANETGKKTLTGVCNGEFLT